LAGRRSRQPVGPLTTDAISTLPNALPTLVPAWEAVPFEQAAWRLPDEHDTRMAIWLERRRGWRKRLRMWRTQPRLLLPRCISGSCGVTRAVHARRSTWWITRRV